MNFFKRKKSREIALQFIYSWNMSKNKNIKNKIKEIKLLNLNLYKNIDKIYFKKIIYGVINNIKYIKKIIKKKKKKGTKYIGKIEKIILYIAIYELKIEKNIPFKVIINESIELAKKFSSNNSYKFINSILDTIYKN